MYWAETEGFVACLLALVHELWSVDSDETNGGGVRTLLLNRRNFPRQAYSRTAWLMMTRVASSLPRVGLFFPKSSFGERDDLTSLAMKKRSTVSSWMARWVHTAVRLGSLKGSDPPRITLGITVKKLHRPPRIHYLGR